MKPRPTHQDREQDPETTDGYVDHDRSEEVDEPSELDEIDLDDECWEAFLADEDERDRQPDYGDFWQDDD